MGVGNVGYFQKLFLKKKTDGVSEEAKHRTSLSKSTDVLLQKYGCFHQRSPMFLFSESAAIVARPCLIEHATATESKVPGKQNTQIIQKKKEANSWSQSLYCSSLIPEFEVVWNWRVMLQLLQQPIRHCGRGCHA